MNKQNIEENIRIAVGEASTCWKLFKNTGVFDTEKAVKISNKLIKIFNAKLEAKDNSWKKKFEKRIYEDEVGIEMLRQWLNEDRITDPDEMVSNEDIKLFLKYKK